MEVLYFELFTAELPTKYAAKASFERMRETTQHGAAGKTPVTSVVFGFCRFVIPNFGSSGSTGCGRPNSLCRRSGSSRGRQDYYLDRHWTEKGTGLIKIPSSSNINGRMSSRRKDSRSPVSNLLDLDSGIL